MKKRSLGRRLSLGLSVLSLAACTQTSGTKIEQAQVNKIQPCVTTEQELLAWFGEPTQRGNQNGLPTMHWVYSQKDTGITSVKWERQNFIVFLSKTGKVSEFFLNPPGVVEAKDACS
jgi:hypothetical protein